MSFKFIEEGSTEFTAVEGTEEQELTISGVFIDQDYTVGFRLGNLDATVSSYQVTASGINASIVDDVTFSVDNGINFETAVQVSGVQPNMISDRVVVKYRAQDEDVLGVGSFLIKVNEQ